MLLASITALVAGGFAFQQYQSERNSLSTTNEETLSSSIESDINASLIAATDKPNFKLFAPAWRGLGGESNKDNVKHFTEIFGKLNPSNIPGKSAGTKVYRYTLGPYGVQGNLPCSLNDPNGRHYINGKCGRDVVPESAWAKGVLNGGGRYNYAVWANQFANWLFVPNAPETLKYAKKNASEVIKFSSSVSYDGLFSDSMGTAPLRSGYTNARPINPNTNEVFTESDWINGQRQMLAAKKSGIGDKVLIINGLATGANYFQESNPSSRLITDAVDGAMAERIFREPHSSMNSHRSESAWRKDVDMVADVESKGIKGYWWTKCWTMGGGVDERTAAEESGNEGDEDPEDAAARGGGGKPKTCTDDAGADAGIKKTRRFAMASYLLGSGSKSYFNYDSDIKDGNAAEWFENDYKKAQQLGSSTSVYRKIEGKSAYVRSFAKGIVVVNPGDGAVSIPLGGTKYNDLDGEQYSSSIEIAAHSGQILLAKDGGEDPSDNERPSVSLSSPSNGSSHSGSIKIKGTADDNRAVKRVALVIDDEVVASDSDSPWFEISLDTTTLENGDHSLRVIAYDTSDNSSKSEAISISVSNSTDDPDEEEPVARIKEFTATPNEVNVGEKSTLKWKTVRVKTCSVTPGGPTDTKEKSWQTPALTTVGEHTFKLDCVGRDGTEFSKSLVVTVKAAEGDTLGKPRLSANAVSVKRGANVNLSWFSRNASVCVLRPGDTRHLGNMGSYTIRNIQNTTTFKVTCSNGTQEKTSDPVRVEVGGVLVKPELKILRFEADERLVESGERTTLRWHVQGARVGGCSIKPSLITSTSTSGSWITPKLFSSITYRLTCYDTKGKTVTKTVAISVGSEATLPEPRATSPTILETASNPVIVDSETSERVDNAAVDGDVDGTVSLDPSNILDSSRIANIDYVEYIRDGEVLQKVSTRPLAFDSTKVGNGRYQLVERTVFKDGSESEVAMTLQVANGESEQSWFSNPWMWLFISLPIAILGGVFYLFRMRKQESSGQIVS